MCVDRCIELHLHRKLDPVDAAACKLVTTDLQFKVMDECLQFFGGWGYMLEYPIARAYADARIVKIAGGSIEIMKYLIGRELFSQKRPREVSSPC